MLLLDDLREQFATFLLANAKAKFRMDAALVHVVTLAYEQGLKDGAKLMEHLHAQPEVEAAGRVGTEAGSAEKGTFTRYGKEVQRVWEREEARRVLLEDDKLQTR